MTKLVSTREMTLFLFATLLVAVCGTVHTSAAPSECRWPAAYSAALAGDCLCGTNNVGRHLIQCLTVNLTALVRALEETIQRKPIDLLHISHSDITGGLGDGLFKSLDIQSLQISKSRVSGVNAAAFQGLEDRLHSLNLQDNLLMSVPTAALRNLRALTTLDLSNNKISKLENDTFAGLKLTTLKLADNHLTIDSFAFRGLERTLKNLNLKGCNLERVPGAMNNLTSLAFLDLAQNKISDISEGSLTNLASLTALNLERNRIHDISASALAHVNDTISSLSLLNNLLTDFPLGAISTLGQLRVLDIGFNGIRNIPEYAFAANQQLTLLALDGNPVKTVPKSALAHLSTTLRGLSVGGKHIECDCRLRWLAEWVRQHNLQVTSRERNPQFCGSPRELSRLNFLQINPRDMICANESRSYSVGSENEVSVTTPTSTTSTTSTTTTAMPPTIKSTTVHPGLTSEPTERSVGSSSSTSSSTTTEHVTERDILQEEGSLSDAKEAKSLDTNIASFPQLFAPHGNSLEVHSLHGGVSIRMTHAYRKGTSIVVEWESQNDNVLGYQVLYREFGEREYRRGPVAAQEARQDRILRAPPPSDCVIVCIIALESVSSNQPITVDQVPVQQCLEVGLHNQSRDSTGGPIGKALSKLSQLDRLVIGVSFLFAILVLTAICTVCCCSRCFCARNPTIGSNSTIKSGISTLAHPMIISGKNGHASPLPLALSSPPMLHNAGNQPLHHPHSPHGEWETMSMYSARTTIPRPKMYAGEMDVRSHMSGYSHYNTLHNEGKCAPLSPLLPSMPTSHHCTPPPPPPPQSVPHMAINPPGTLYAVPHSELIRHKSQPDLHKLAVQNNLGRRANPSDHSNSNNNSHERTPRSAYNGKLHETDLIVESCKKSSNHSKNSTDRILSSNSFRSNMSGDYDGGEEDSVMRDWSRSPINYYPLSPHSTNWKDNQVDVYVDRNHILANRY